MIPKFIQINTVTIGATVYLTALDEAGSVWAYTPLRFRDSPSEGQWTRLSNARVVEQGKETP